MCACLETYLPVVDQVVSILQGLVIIAATLFTARWTYKTFAHKEKIGELKELKATVELYFRKMQVFCGQVRSGDTPDDKEIAEKLELAQLHNRLVSLANHNLYTKREFRDEVQDIVGRWATGDRIKRMQRGRSTSPPEEEIAATWQMFNEEYDTVGKLIDKEAARFV